MADDPKRLVAERLAKRRRRTVRLRKRVIAASGSTFVLAWGVIFVQLVSGHDPALAHKASTTTTAATTTAATSNAPASSTSSSSASSSAATTPVTTSQS
jgi:cytoskeletal protein RodZ